MIEVFEKLDLSILLWVQDNFRTEFLTLLMRHITSIGSIMLAILAGWFIVKGSSKERFVGITAFVSVVVEVVIVNGVLKKLLARPRPFVVTDEIVPLVNILSEFSFPSGHTALSFAMAFVFYWFLPQKYGIPAIVIATLVGVSRIYLGVHYSSDVVGGVMVAYAASQIAGFIVPKFYEGCQK